jgi:hypothetical protein
MVGRAFDRHAALEQAPDRRRQRGAVGEENREVKEARRSGRGARRAPAGPRIEPDVMMVVAGGQEHGVRAVARRDLETQHVAIERHRAIEVADGQMDMADAGAGIDAQRSGR